MSPDRLKAWYQRARRAHPQAVSMRALHERFSGADPVPVCEWTCEDLDVCPDLAALVRDACQDYADALEESARYRIELIGSNGDACASTVHKATPRRASSPDALQAADAGSPNAERAMLMRHLENRERMLAGHQQIVLGAVGTMLGSMKQVIEMQQNELRAQREHQATLLARLEVAMSRDDGEREQSEEERAEALERSRAWSRLAELGPPALQLALAKMGVDARFLNNDEDGGNA